MNAPIRMAPAALRLAARANDAQGSIVREILRFAQRPGVISLAGGLPAAQSFPVDALRGAFDAVLRDEGRTALQYSMTEGDPQLRAWIAARETAKGMPTTADEVLIVAGSQQAIDLIGKAFVDRDAPVLIESPTYLAALQAFAVFDARYVALPTDDDGLQPEGIDAAVARGARFAYVMPNFQNPTGRTLSAARRADLAQRARALEFWLVEDDPYGELWYDVAPPASLRAHAPERTIRISSFSKVLAPGLRVGYVIAPREAIEVLVRLKQATDLHTSTLAQRAVAQVVEDGLLERQMPGIRALYAQQCRAMLDALAAHMPEGVTWTRPLGGMFVWLTLPADCDTMALLDLAIANDIAFVPGAPFFAADAPRNTMRLSFVTVAPESIEHGVRTLARLIRTGA